MSGLRGVAGTGREIETEMTQTEKQIIIALIRGLKFMASLLEKVKKGEAV